MPNRDNLKNISTEKTKDQTKKAGDKKQKHKKNFHDEYNMVANQKKKMGNTAKEKKSGSSKKLNSLKSISK